MRATIDCIPCFLRQALEGVRFTSDDPEVHERVLREILRLMAQVDLTQPPPAVAQIIHKQLRVLVHNADPYRAAKERANSTALALLPELQARVAKAADPFDMATRLAIAGNVIDLAAKSELGSCEIRTEIQKASSKPLAGDIEALRRAVSEARRILYLTDNAGEIVFDSLLLERLPAGKVTVATRGAPVINDATLADARAAGLGDIAGEVIENGSDAPGTVLADCSPAFVCRFNESDLVIAKGQGNFESISNEAFDGAFKRIFYLFRVKCPVVAERSDRPVGSHVLMHEIS